MAAAGVALHPRPTAAFVSCMQQRPCCPCRLTTSSSPLSSVLPRLGRSRRSFSAGSRLSQPVAAQSVGAEEGPPRQAKKRNPFPDGFRRYETMIVLRPDLTDEERDVELAKFEAFLAKQGGYDVNAMVRGRQELAYPIRKHWDGIYVLYEYVAPRQATPQVQKYLSTPAVGAENNVLRHMTFAK